MSRSHPLQIRHSLLAVALGAVLGAPAGAAVPVEESRPSAAREEPAQQRRMAPIIDGSAQRQSTRGAQAAAQAAGPAAAGEDATTAVDGGESRLGSLFYQLQVLQQEVQELRGLVEEQGYQLKRLARDQQEQYLDLDRRMQALRGGGNGAAPAASSGGGPSPDSASRDSGVPAGSSGGSFGGGSRSEREAYTAAFELMKQRQFDASAEAFNRLVLDYPNGAYTPNAFYWLGELYLAQEQNEQARQSFAQVVNLYPDHQKVPDALYKLGVVYHRLGDTQRAREYLSRVRRDHPQSSAASLAETYLAEL